MENTNIILNKKTWAVTIGDSSSMGADDVMILTHNEIMADLPELLRHGQVADAVKTTVLRGIKNFTTVELPMVGTGRIAVTVNNVASGIAITPAAANNVKQVLLTGVMEMVFDTVRIPVCLKSKEIEYVYEVIPFGVENMRKCRNFGKDSERKLREFLQTNQIEGEVCERLKNRSAELESVAVGTIPEILDSECFAALKRMTATIEDIGLLPMKDWTGGTRWHSSFYWKVFPNGNDHPGTSATKYEKSFNKEECEKINELALQIKNRLLEFRRNEMRKFIQNM